MKVVFYGTGNMASSIFRGILQTKIIEPDNIYLTNHSNKKALESYSEELGIKYSYDDKSLLTEADYVFLGSEPYQFEKLSQRIKPYVKEKNKFISMMAGLSISHIQKILNIDNPIIRIMPNTNAQIGYSVTGVSFSNNINNKSKEEVHTLINAFGSVIEVSEDKLHLLTAVFGGGPAFLYHICEQYVEAGISLGIEKNQMEQGIQNLMIGTSKMMESSNLSMEQLKENNNSEGGTTEAGLKILSEHSIKQMFEYCFNASTNKSKALSNESIS